MTARTRTTALAALLGTLATIALAIPPADAADTPATADLVGEWQGTLAVGDARLRLVVHLQESDDGTLEATLDSPDQGATGIPVERVTVDGAAITLDVTAIRAVYAGILTADRNVIEGEWRQSGMTLPLTVARVEE